MKTVFLLLALVALAAQDVPGQQELVRPTVNVSGTAEVLVVPDQAEVRMTVRTLDLNLQLARSKNDEMVKQVFRIATDLRIDPSDVQTDILSVQPEYTDEDDSPRPPKFLGYAMSKRIVIVVRDIKVLERLIPGVLLAGVTRLDEVDFQSSKMREHSDEARAMAVRAAREKAAAMASELGQSIGKAIHISETQNQIPYGFTANSSSFDGRASASDAISTTVALGKIRISARIQIVFELH